MMSKIQKSIILFMAIIVLSTMNSFNSYCYSSAEAVLDAYNVVSNEQKELLYKNLKQIIEEEWAACIKDHFESEKRISILKNSKYENGKLVSKNYNYHIGKVATPSTIPAFVNCLDIECDMRDYWDSESTEDGKKQWLQNNTMSLVAKIINKDENVTNRIKQFVSYVDMIKKTVGQTIVGDNAYINFTYDSQYSSDYDREIVGLSVLYRGDLYYYRDLPYSRHDILEFITKEGILK